MKKTLLILVLAVIVLSWNFIFSSSKKIQLTDPAKVLQGLSLTFKYKLAVRDLWQQQGTLPDAATWQQFATKPQVDISKSLVKSIEVGLQGPGEITVTYENKPHINVNESIDGKTITLKPQVKGDKLVWSCSSTLSNALLPKACQ